MTKPMFAFILDTNILVRDYWFASPRAQRFLDFVDRTRSEILLPDLVRKELLANYERKLTEAATRARNSIDELRKLDPSIDPMALQLDIENASGRYWSNIVKRLRIRHGSLLPTKPEYLPDVIERAIHRKRPCTEQGEEMRDALIWCCVLDYCREHQETKVTFISSNSKQFCGASPETLHDELLAELGQQQLAVLFYRDLDHFIRDKGEALAHITDDWLAEKVPDGRVAELVQEYLERYSMERIARRIGSHERLPITELTIGSIECHLEKFFVYRMSSGELSIQADYHCVATIEYKTLDENRLGNSLSWTGDWRSSVDVYALVDLTVSGDALTELAIDDLELEYSGH